VIARKISGPLWSTVPSGMVTVRVTLQDLPCWPDLTRWLSPGPREGLTTVSSARAAPYEKPLKAILTWRPSSVP
jgi:hypothetical protein